MAGDWIKMRTDLAEDPAVIAMASKLNVDEDLIVGKLHRLWSWADRQSRDGHAVGVTNVWLDRYIRHEGFARAMQDVGWLVVDSSGVTFPNFDRHNGETAKTRALGAKRKAKQRGNVTQSVHDMSRSDRDINVTREEKRREEVKEKKTCPDEAEAGSPGKLELTGDGPADLTARKVKRIQQIAIEAQDAYNAILGKPNGLLTACTVLNRPRMKAVEKSLPTARIICQQIYGNERITQQFWQDYFREASLDPFHSGRGPYKPPHENWRPDFEFLLREDVMAKLFDRAQSAGSSEHAA